MKVEQIAVADLIPYAKNARTHSDAQVAQIAASIREFGFCNPVLIDADSGIIAGHGRVLAALKLGMETVPCLRWEHVSKSMRRNGAKDVICQDCGSEFSARKDTHPSICRRCASARGWKASSSKPQNERWRTDRKPCATCGKPIRETLGYTYCSVTCRMKHKITDRVCKTCGKTFQVLKSVLSEKTNSAGNFCCRSCYEKWLCNSERTTGRGSQWKKTRALKVSKQPFCALCGTFKDIQVHHIVPFRLTHDNSQENLVSLCVKHHKVVESITHDIEIVENDFNRMKLVLGSMLTERVLATAEKLKSIRK